MRNQLPNRAGMVRWWRCCNASQKSFLGQVLGQVEVVQYTHTHRVHGLLIPLNEGPEGDSVPLQGTSPAPRHCHVMVASGWLLVMSVTY